MSIFLRVCVSVCVFVYIMLYFDVNISHYSKMLGNSLGELGGLGRGGGDEAER